MHVTTFAHPDVGDDGMDYDGLIGGGVVGGAIALLGAAFPFVREWYQNRSKTTEVRGQVDAKQVDVSAIVAAQFQHYTDQMTQRISTLERNEKDLRTDFEKREIAWEEEIEELKKENEDCKRSNVRLTRQVTDLTRKNSERERENKMLRDTNTKHSAEIRKMQRALDFTPLEVPNEHPPTIRSPAPATHIEMPFKKGPGDGK